MMELNAAQLILEVKSQGLGLSVCGDHLLLESPCGKAAITQDLRLALKAHKPAIMATLRSKVFGVCLQPEPVEQRPARTAWNYEMEKGLASGTYLSAESNEAEVVRILEKRHGGRVVRLERIHGRCTTPPRAQK